MNQQQTPLFDALKQYHQDNVIPFDVPGHKHGKGLKELCDFLGSTVMEVDVNSMKCLDNLSNPKGVIAESEKLMALAYGGEHGFFLVNGTSCGVQAMIMSVCRPGDKIIMPRNAHKSAINGLILSGAIPVYVQPEFNKELGIAFGLTTENLKKSIEEHPEAKAVFLINPTYFGAVSELESIVELAHAHGMAVLVDEAHGAHLAFHDELPVSAMAAGADMSAVSLHKTGGSLTQSSALIMQGDRVSRHKVRKILNLSQTTSASYLLMTSLDLARRNLAVNGQALLEGVLGLSRYAREEINVIHGFHAFGKELEGTPGVHKFDETKLVINTRGIGLTGFHVYDMLREEYNIQMELGDAYNVLAIISLGDDRHALDTLIDALKDISKRFGHQSPLTNSITPPEGLKPGLSPRDAFYGDIETVRILDSVGRISAESVMAYPPGIPIVAPGEKITQEVIEYIEFLKSEGTLITDLEDENIEYIKVIQLQYHDSDEE